MFEWARVIEYFPQIIQKFPVTLQIVLGSFVIGMILGCIFAVIRIKKIPVLNQLVVMRP